MLSVIFTYKKVLNTMNASPNDPFLTDILIMHTRETGGHGISMLYTLSHSVD